MQICKASTLNVSWKFPPSPEDSDVETQTKDICFLIEQSGLGDCIREKINWVSLLFWQQDEEANNTGNSKYGKFSN